MSTEAVLQKEERTKPSAVHAKAMEILGEFGKPATTEVLYFEHPLKSYPTGARKVAIAEAPIVPVRIFDKEYKLRLRTGTDGKKENKEEFYLSIHFQQLPAGLQKVEHDEEGNTVGYWVKPEEDAEPKYVDLSHSAHSQMPKELDFGWFIANSYTIIPDSIEDHENINYSDRIEIPGDRNTFLLNLLGEMHNKLKIVG